MSEKRGFFGRIGQFLEGFRRFVLNAMTLLVILLIVAVLVIDRGEEVPDGSALILDLKGSVVDEYSLLSPLEQLQQGAVEREVLLTDIQTAVARAAKDDRIKLLVLSLNELDYIGISKASELIPALQIFRDSGKPILAVADYFDQDDYYLAVHADEIYTHPLGGVLLEGFASYRNYYREALDKLDVEVDIFRVGEFKSALEPFMRNDMSAEARDAAQSLVDQLWEQYRDGLVVARDLDPGEIDFYVNRIDELMAQADGDTARVAANARLVDGILNHAQWMNLLESRVGKNAAGDLNRIGLRDYLRATRPEDEEPGDKVAVVVVAGAIMPGESSAGIAGADTIVERIGEAIHDDAVKSVVLRIDSPGGSVFASEQIRNQLTELRAAGKPWVVSMGSVAASGGYWIAAEANRIFATPATLTGSIGVFGARPSLGGTLNNLGIYSDGVTTSPLAGALRLDRPLSDVARRSIQTGVEFTYAKFLDIVGTGRAMTREEVERVARGRVWTGAESVGLKLVDEIGGLKQAAKSAAELAGLESYELVWIEDEFPVGVQIFKGMFDDLGGAVPQPLQRLLTLASEPVNTLGKLRDKRGVYAWCPGCVAP